MDTETYISEGVSFLILTVTFGIAAVFYAIAVLSIIISTLSFAASIIYLGICFATSTAFAAISSLVIPVCSNIHIVLIGMSILGYAIMLNHASGDMMRLFTRWVFARHLTHPTHQQTPEQRPGLVLRPEMNERIERAYSGSSLSTSGSEETVPSTPKSESEMPLGTIITIENGCNVPWTTEVSINDDTIVDDETLYPGYEVIDPKVSMEAQTQENGRPTQEDDPELEVVPHVPRHRHNTDRPTIPMDRDVEALLRRAVRLNAANNSFLRRVGRMRETQRIEFQGYLRSSEGLTSSRSRGRRHLNGIRRGKDFEVLETVPEEKV